jgi:hypothetical protein
LLERPPTFGEIDERTQRVVLHVPFVQLTPASAIRNANIDQSDPK